MAEIGLSEADVDALTGIIWDSGTIEPVLPSDWELREELLAQWVEFGNGEENGLVLQASKKLCDALGNCRAWFFRRDGGKWKSVANQRVDNEGVSILEFAIEEAKSNKPGNLVLIKHSMDDNFPTRIWEFEDAVYAPKRFYCWHPDKNVFEQKPCVDLEIALHMPDQSLPPSRRGKFSDEFLTDLGEGKSNGLAERGKDGLCGVTGNCTTWFQRKVGGQWSGLLLDGSDDDGSIVISMFAAVPPRHNGLYELILARHLNAFDTPFQQFWFDGEKYVLHAKFCRYGETGEVLAGDCE